MASAVMFSGGACSYLAAKRWKEVDPGAVLLFSDTGIEDEDLYRFIGQAAESLGLELVRISSGETFDEMCARNNAIPNDRMPFCSRELKVLPAKKWLSNHPEIDTLVFGLDWTETHRLPKVQGRWPKHKCVAPMMDPPLMMKQQMIGEIEADGIAPPRLYAMGMAHNNCGGGCVRNGHSAWKHLARVFPERFEEWADREERLGRGYTFSRKQINGERVPITIRQLCASVSMEPDYGGCGCFVDDAE